MSITLVSHTNKAVTAGTTTIVTSSIDTTGATLIIISEGFFGTTNGGTLTDSKLNTWTALTQRDRASLEQEKMYYSLNPTVGTGHTFSVSSSSLGCICVAAFSGAGPFDKETGATGTATTSHFNPGSITPTLPNSLIVTGATGQAGASALTAIGSSFTITDNNSGPGGANEPEAFAYLVQTTSAAINPQWTCSGISGAFATEIAVFGPASSTSTQTLLGKARIQETSTQTLLGKARIQETSTQTILGKARIGLITNQTLLGKARITASTLQTLLGKARIQETSTQTLLGKARIGLVTKQTLLGVARMLEATNQTLPGKSRIQLIMNQTLTGKASIGQTSTQILLGLGRIGHLTIQTLLGKARIFHQSGLSHERTFDALRDERRWKVMPEVRAFDALKDERQYKVIE